MQKTFRVALIYILVGNGADFRWVFDDKLRTFNDYSEKKYNSLKKNVNRKTSKDDNTESTNNHIASASLDRKYLKFLGGSTKQNIVPVPTAQFRSYRRVPPGNVTEGGMSSVTANR